MMKSVQERGRTLAAVAVAAALVACGGGSDSSQPQKIAGVTAFGEGAKVCVDLNKNLQCDAGESAVVADADGRYEILLDAEVDLSSIMLAAEPELAKVEEGQPRRMVALADWAGEINVLSTLVTAKVLSQSAADASAAYGQISQAFGMAEGVNLRAVWSNIEPMAQTGLRTAAELVREHSGAEVPRTQVMTQASTALMSTLARYVDGATGQMLPLVTAHSIKTDLQGTVGLEFCAVPQVQRLAIVTEGGAPVLDKENYVNASVVLQDAEGAVLADALGARIRGRGNSTWDMPKKPFKLKLDDAADLLGMAKGKDWALLANYADKTLLRNELAFCLARTLGMPYTPQSRFVELTLNGEYLGQYQLTNKTDEIEVELKATAKQEGVNTDVPLDEFNDVFLIEMDEREDSDFPFRTQTTLPYAIQTDSDAEQAARIERWFNHLEDVLRDRNVEDRVGRVAEYIDLESLVDFSLVNELMKNNDVFFSSTNMYRSAPDGKLFYGPVWDFDIAASNYNMVEFLSHPYGWYLPERFNGWYFNTLMEEPKFRALRDARWKYLSSQLQRVDEFVKNAALAMDASQARNFERWPILDQWVWPNVLVLGSHEAEVQYLRDWIAERARWIDQNIGG